MQKCKQCGIEFHPSSKQISGCCSRSCASRFAHSLPGQKEKRSIAIKNAMADPKIRKKMSLSLKIANSRPEVRKKISIANKAALSDLEFRSKRTAAMKAAFNTPESKARRSHSMKIAYQNPETKNKIVSALMIANARPDVRLRKSISRKILLSNPINKARMVSVTQAALAKPEVIAKRNLALASPHVIKKIYNTKKKNNSFNTSKDEKELVTLAKAKWGDKIKDQYMDSRYSGIADLYINTENTKDTFVEFHFHWTHGKEPYDSTNHKHQEIIKAWEAKSKTSQYYANAIDKFIHRDPMKVKTAKDNGLNLLVFYKPEEAKNWLLQQGAI